MTKTDDLAACADMIKHGSLSFHAASKLLPQDVRSPALALYAFCRLADDAVDLQSEKAAAVLRLRERLERVYAGRPDNAAPDRAFAAVVEQFDMPRALPNALLEGLAWDAMGRRYDTMSDVFSYSARVAAAVGAMMCVLMRVRDANALARACDLGVAMQLTNIARDVGEDAGEGRLYLPLAWFSEIGQSPEAFLADPHPTPKIRNMVKRLVLQADRLYYRSEAGIGALPASCRPGIFAARHIYAGIGGRLARMNFDSLTARARTSKPQKIGWLMMSAARAATSSVMPQSAVLFARPLRECDFLVKAAATGEASKRSALDGLLGSLQTLAAQDRAARDLLIEGQPRSS